MSDESLFDDLPESCSALLLAPSMAAGADDVCGDLLLPESPEREDVLSVTFTESPDDRLDAWRRHADTLPAKMAIVNVDGRTRSAAVEEASTNHPAHPITIATVTDPADLTGIGIRTSEVLGEWADDGNRVVVCFHSLTTLLQYVEFQQAFRFLHVLTTRLKDVGAVAHFHLDPGAHDDRTVSRLTELFDAVVELSADGEVSVRSR